ncbi:TonB-dependent receptor domain-containing protein [Sphingomonas bacterium]|uniref:TonB-dependent receptor domain-containing protein n=1 Tax=Sphingomonas bacterium TaxID=1895847 RepID=UPI0020C5BE34|nr:TonB-dependent receptor [Sphingomonas bacterium]
MTSTLLVGAALAATPAIAQTQTDTSGIRAGGATATQETTPGANAQGEVGLTTSEAAPTTPNSQGDIVVTGSLIKNPALVAAAPVQVIGQEEIQLRQSNTAEEILRDLPGAVPNIGSAVNNGNGGASYVDLRGLGSFRNVVLLDGNRIAPSGLLGRVDLNNIPLALVERVDVLTGGAATTYGADAVSGVVNFITRSNFAGVDAQASNQITEKGDGRYFRGDLTIGANFDGGRGNAVFSIGYQNADPVYQGDRNYSVQNYDSFSGAAGGSGTTVPSVFTFGGRRQIVPATGTLSTTVVPFNFNPYNIFQTPFRRYNMYGAAHYEVSDSLEVYTRGLFSKNTVDTIIAPSGVFGSSVQIPLSNPYLPLAARNQFCASAATSTADFDPYLAGIQTLSPANCALAAAATTTTDPNYREIATNLSRRTTEVGPRISDYVTTIFDYRAGLKLGITQGIKLDVSGGYGESENTQTLQGYVLTSRVRSAVYATNTTTCLGGATGGASLTAGTGCVPLNVFGDANSITAAQIPYITGESTTAIRTSLAQARAVLNGDFGFTSPLASTSIGFAAGAEYRKYRASQRSDTLAQTAGELGGAGGAAPNIDGGYEVSEGFGEVIAPLIQDRSFFRALTFEGGVRYSHYKVDAAASPTFNTTTYKAGGSWEPASGLKFSGTYQRAVRAPNISELFSPVSTGLTNLAIDPCAGAGPTTNANLRAVCIAQGAPASTIGLILNPTAGQANSTSGGNINLKPETSNSFTGSLILQPQQIIPGFSVRVDYYNIKIKGAVSSFAPGDLVGQCFGTAPAYALATTTNPACGSFARNPVTGGLDGDVATTRGLLTQISNLGLLKTSGIDLGINYRRTLTSYAKLSLGFQGNYTRDSKFQAAPGTLDRECTGYYSANCASIQPEFYWNTRATMTLSNDVDISVLWRHIDGVRYEPALITNAATTPFSGTITTGQLAGQTFNFGRIPSYDYFDLSFRFRATDNFDFGVTVDNLLNKEPPVVGSTVGSTSFNSGNTYPSTYDSLGRHYAFSARLHF